MTTPQRGIMDRAPGVDDFGRQYTTSVPIAPSSYSALKSASTTVAGQSEALPAGATKLRVRNLDGTNYVLIAFGTSLATAESNAATGIAIEFGQVETITIPADATHWAWLGDTGTVSINAVFGV